MSKKLLLSALLSVTMMTGFAISSHASAEKRAIEYADCQESKWGMSREARDGSTIPARLLLSMLTN
jgi:hypothetical protein